MPPPSGFDYSKWDKLELSDDEDDHPGAKFIEENTLRRIKRETHGRQEQERGEKIEALTKTIEEGTKQLDVANGDGGSGSLSHAEKRAIEKTIEDAKLDLQKTQRERKFNADEMCYVSSERTLVGDACKPDTGNGDLDYEGKYFPITTFRRLIAHTRLTLSFLSLQLRAVNKREWWITKPSTRGHTRGCTRSPR